MTDGTSGPTPRPMRADARRKQHLLLLAARETFGEQGTDASLREVARRAGVGIGTLYRHFPTREALLEALLGQGFDTLNTRATELLTEPDPGAALVVWLREMAVASTRYDGLPASVIAALRDPRSPLHASCEGLWRAAADLLARAQQSGQVRADLTAEELLATANAMAWAAKQLPGDVDHTNRYLDLLVAGLKARQ